MKGRMVMMDLSSQPEYKKIGIIIEVNKPNLYNGENRITYDILVDGRILRNQLYEYFYEIETRRF